VLTEGFEKSRYRIVSVNWGMWKKDWRREFR
jgi:hypothetical protein